MWSNAEKIWSALPDVEVADAVQRLSHKCEGIIDPNIAPLTVRTAMENRLCSRRRSWQRSKRQSSEPPTRSTQYAECTSDAQVGVAQDQPRHPNPMSIDSLVSRPETDMD